MNRFWIGFFVAWPIVAVGSCLIAPQMGWWFPGGTAEHPGLAGSPLGVQIDDLFHLILIVTAVTFIGVHIALGYVLWTGIRAGADPSTKATFSHGSHNLEVIWTIVPAGILLFIALYQMDVWAQFRIQSNFPEEATRAPVAEVTARQFEWRIRYPAPGKKLQLQPQPDDLYTVNDLRVPAGRPVLIQLRTMDVQHSFFVPEMRIKQDAVPGLVIPVWFEASRQGDYDLVCAELCGWGHYKMKARVKAQTDDEYHAYLQELQQYQFDDGVAAEAVTATEADDGQ